MAQPRRCAALLTARVRNKTHTQRARAGRGSDCARLISINIGSVDITYVGSKLSYIDIPQIKIRNACFLNGYKVLN